jgi:hypothetical protein
MSRKDAHAFAASLATSSEAGDDRTDPSQVVGRGAVPVSLDLAVVVLRRAAGRDGAEP